MSPYLLTGCALSVFIAGAALQFLKEPMEIYIALVIGSALLVALSTVFQIQVMTYLQILTPENLIGKVVACFICICMCTNPLGQFIYGIVFEKIGSSVYLPFYAAALIMIGITFFTRRLFSGIDPLTEQHTKEQQMKEQAVAVD